MQFLFVFFLALCDVAYSSKIVRSDPPASFLEVPEGTIKGLFLPAVHQCDDKFVTEYFKKYPKESEKTEKAAAIAESLQIVHDVLLENNLPTILEGGSTLGFYRNCGVIPHDGDGDIALLGSWLNDEKVSALNTSFAKRGVELATSLCPGGTNKTGCEMRAIFDKAHVDLLVYATKEECKEAPCNYFSSLWSGGSTEEGYFYPCDTGPIHFEQAAFLGKTFWIPAPTMDYLKGQYGEVWQDPEGGVYKGCHFDKHDTPVPDVYAGKPPPGEYVVKLMRESMERRLSSLAENEKTGKAEAEDTNSASFLAEKEKEKEKEKEAEKEKQKEAEKEKEKEAEKEKEKEKGTDKEKEADKEKDQEKDKSEDKEKDKDKEKEHEKEQGTDKEKDEDKKEKEKEKDKDKGEDKGKEKDKEKDEDKDNDKEKDEDKEKKRGKGKDKKNSDKEKEKHKEKEEEKEKDKEKDEDKEKEKEKDKEKDEDKEKEKEKDQEKDKDKDKQKDKEKDKEKDEDKDKDDQKDKDKEDMEKEKDKLVSAINSLMKLNKEEKKEKSENEKDTEDCKSAPSMLQDEGGCAKPVEAQQMLRGVQRHRVEKTVAQPIAQGAFVVQKKL